MIPMARTPPAPALEWRRVLDHAAVSLAHPVPEECIDARAGRHVLEDIGLPV